MSDYYDEHADRLVSRYESKSPDKIHREWAHLIPETRGIALEVGAGSGRDAEWLAVKGHEVLAVEPSDAMRSRAENLHQDARIKWIDDSLPGLEEVYRLDYQFDIILLSAVWMHIRPSHRERSFRKLAHLMRPGGVLVITLRSKTDDRPDMYPVDGAAVHEHARRLGLTLVVDTEVDDAHGREHITWQTLVFRLPDDGTEALPLIRHVVVNDDVSSTYKLALLRAILRVADGARGVVLKKTQEHVSIPFGLLSLYWIRQYQRLVLDYGFLQRPGRNQLGFAREKGFEELHDLSPYDLRVGMRFTGNRARKIIRALRDARSTIKKMPANYITFPGSEEHVFTCEVSPTHLRDAITLDLEFLRSMGTFTIPRTVWDAMSRYACWIEPAIIDRWCDLMQQYDKAAARDVPLQHYRRSLNWLDVERSTAEARRIISDLQAQGQHLYCTWSGRRLHRNYDVDHCFPFAHWPNNDLWNLLPVHPEINNEKRDRLPSAERMRDTRDRVLEWWHNAYLTPRFEDRFLNEASVSLPLVRSFKQFQTPTHGVFAGLQNQRIRLKTDQQLVEWKL